MDLFNGMDWGAYNTFRYSANRMPELTRLLELVSWLGTYAAGGVLLLLAVTCTRQPRRLRMAWVAGLTFLIGFIIIEGTNRVTLRARPADAEDLVGRGAMLSSFPSRGAFLAAFAWPMLALALERSLARRSLRIAIHVLAALAVGLVCFSQLWLGLNWVSDVLAGLAGGAGLALIGRWWTDSRGIRSNSSPGLPEPNVPQAAG